ncbi:alpha/beta fold hydrolase [Noviherbaspirillum denitrificans]|nr:alpha/beta hydrolase [Noviherbaspirillum denitrificans]
MTYWTDLVDVEHRIAYVDAGGIHTRYLDAGPRDAEVVLFLHGSGGYLEAYSQNVRAHARHFRVIALDMLGHGYTDKPDHPYEPKHYVKHIVDFLDALGIARAHVSGESLGGWVAARLASTHPERVGKIVLNTAAGVHYDPEVSARIHTLSLNAVNNLNPENVRKRLEWLMLDPARVTDEMVEMRYRVYAQPGFPKTMAHIMCLHTAEFRVPNLMTPEEMAKVKAPALVLWTSHDPGSSVEIGRRLASMIPDSKFVVMDNCGHWPQFEDAENFNKLHIDFLLN